MITSIACAPNAGCCSPFILKTRNQIKIITVINMPRICVNIAHGSEQKCRLHLPVCLKSPNVNKRNRQSFSICENCSQGNENIIGENNHNKKRENNLSILACSTAGSYDEGNDKSIDGKSVLLESTRLNVTVITPCRLTEQNRTEISHSPHFHHFAYA